MNSADTTAKKRKPKYDHSEKRLRTSVKTEFKEHRALFILYFILRALVIVTMVFQFFNGNYENVFLCVLTLILLILPNFVEHRFHIMLPDTLEIVILLFIFAAEILGEIRAYYITFPYWDTMLHTINGFLAAAIGFSLVDLLNRDDRFSFKLSPLFMAIVAFCFSMTIGVLWEFFEFGMDAVFGFDMQKDTVISAIHSVTLDPTGTNKVVSINGITQVLVNGQELNLGGYLDIGLIDTMADLFVNFVGAVVFSVMGYFYVKTKGKGKIARQFIPYVRRETPPAETEEEPNTVVAKQKK